MELSHGLSVQWSVGNSWYEGFAVHRQLVQWNWAGRALQPTIEDLRSKRNSSSSTRPAIVVEIISSWGQACDVIRRFQAVLLKVLWVLFFFSSSLTLDRRLESIKCIPLFLQCWENLVWLKFSKLSWCIFQLFIPCTFSDLTWRIMALKFPQWETFYMAVTKSLLVRIYTLEIVPGKRSSR